jgi:hypothetical protein
MRCKTRVNKNRIAESGRNKHYSVAENELYKNLPITVFITTEKRMEQTEN